MTEKNEKIEEKTTEENPEPIRDKYGRFTSPNGVNRRKEKKITPTNVVQLIEAIEGGRLDLRSRQSKTIQAVKQLLSEDVEVTASELIKMLISQNMAVLQSMAANALNKPSVVDETGNLCRSLSDYFLAYQRETRGLLRDLRDIEKARKKNKQSGKIEKQLDEWAGLVIDPEPDDPDGDGDPDDK